MLILLLAGLNEYQLCGNCRERYAYESQSMQPLATRSLVPPPAVAVATPTTTAVDWPDSADADWDSALSQVDTSHLNLAGFFLPGTYLRSFRRMTKRGLYTE